MCWDHIFSPLSLVCYIGQSSVFLFKQRTAYEMRISDWSSDVCSSDLTRAEVAPVGRLVHEGLHRADGIQRLARIDAEVGDAVLAGAAEPAHAPAVGEDRQQHHRQDRKSTRLNSSH